MAEEMGHYRDSHAVQLAASGGLAESERDPARGRGPGTAEGGVSNLQGAWPARLKASRVHYVPSQATFGNLPDLTAH